MCSECAGPQNEGVEFPLTMKKIDGPGEYQIWDARNRVVISRHEYEAVAPRPCQMKAILDRLKEGDRKIVELKQMLARNTICPECGAKAEAGWNEKKREIGVYCDICKAWA